MVAGLYGRKPGAEIFEQAAFFLFIPAIFQGAFFLPLLPEDLLPASGVNRQLAWPVPGMSTLQTSFSTSSRNEPAPGS